ncbi:MAG: hypothetical protein ACRC7N_21210 [Clostridium sp.]
MLLSNRETVKILEGIGNITSIQMPVKASYAISKNVKKLEKEAKIYNLEREKLLNKYGEKNEDGTLKVSENGSINIIDIENWNNDITELLDIENEIDIHTFNINEILHCNMSAKEINLISFMIEE